MSLRSVPFAFVAALLLAGCAGAPGAPSPATQRVVESVAAHHPDCIRLSVHALPQGGGDYVAVASTSDSKRGVRSDPEDLRAMQTGKEIVLDEANALDVTVPILQQGGKWTASCGITLRADAGRDRDQLLVQARAIAQAVEAGMQKGSDQR